MRTAFIETLMECAQEDPRVCLLVGDLGFSVVEPFREAFPDRYCNMGVAEQNMTGVAAGWAHSQGACCFTYSIANFPIIRCLEQIRNDVCYHKANVKIVSVGGGLAYGTAGYSHYAVEDIAILRSLPGIRMFTPADPMETRAAVKEMVADPGPCYLRIEKNGEVPLHDAPPSLGGGVLQMRQGTDGMIIAVGTSVRTALVAADELARKGLSFGVLSAAIVSPFDTAGLVEAVARVDVVVTLEEHVLPGGLGSSVLEALSDAKVCKKVTRLGLNTSPLNLPLGSQAFLREELGLDASGLVDAIYPLIS